MFAFTLIAQEELEDLNLGELLSISIETGSFLELDFQNSPISMNIIDKNDIAISNTYNLGELLEIYVPGFQVMENKWVGEIWGMRGVASDINTKFILMINGNKTNAQSRDGTIAEMYSNIGPDVERVEVLRGPAGLVYGSGAIAGIINIVTKRTSEDEDYNAIVNISDGQYNVQNGYRTLAAYGQFKLPVGLHVGLSGYVQQSNGVGMNNSKLYGLPSWNFPQWVAPEGNYNAWSDSPYQTTGSTGRIPIKFMFSTNLEYRDFRLYIRYSHSERAAAGFFFDEPDAYKGIMSDDQTEIDNYLTKIGKGYLINDPNHLFYSASEAWGENRRIYGTDNILTAFTYERLTTNENKIKLKLTQSIMSEYIKYEKIESYLIPDDEPEYMEQFGEKRTGADVLYLLQSVPKLKFALGAQYRFDNIGKDISGKNQVNEDSKSPVVTNVNYHTIALFSEGTFEPINQLTFHGGIRLDKHTRTDFVPSPKISLILSPFGKESPHTYKLYYQTASNNGSADSYEFNRYVPRDDDGIPIESDYFEDPTLKPNADTDVIRAISIEELHSLKPEKTKSLELSTFDKFLNDIFELETSVSYNMVENLFMWNQDYYHSFNTTNYKFGVIEAEARVILNKFNIGINHSYTELIDMNYTTHNTIYSCKCI